MNPDLEPDYQAECAMANAQAGMKDMDPEFIPIFEGCRRFSMTSAERMYAIFQAIQFIVRADIPGDLVECGVWRGGSMMVAAKTLLTLGDLTRKLWLYDTYEGHPAPEFNVDMDIWGDQAFEHWRQATNNGEGKWAFVSLDEVRRNMESTLYPMDQIHFVKGLVEDTMPEYMPNRISLLRLDTDWYRPTCHELQHLYPRISQHGTLIIDDYGHFQGARKAVDEYFLQQGCPILLQRVDYTCRLGIKTHEKIS